MSGALEAAARAAALALALAIGGGWLAELDLVASPLRPVALLGWLADSLAQFQLVYGAALALVLAVFALRRRWRAVLLCVPLAAAVGIRLWPYAGPLMAPAHAAGGTEIRVAALNLWFRNEHPQSIAAWIAENAPDILVLSEATREMRVALSPVLARYPHQLGTFGGPRADVLVLSRLPLTPLPIGGRGEAEYMIQARACWVEGTREGRPRCLRLIAAHLPSPVSPGRVVARDRMLALIGETLANAGDEPRLVMGDLNTTPWAPGFRAMVASAGLVDSAAGRRPRPTWNARLPVAVVPIDHILVGGPLAVVARDVGPFVDSDHLPVSARLRL